MKRATRAAFVAAAIVALGGALTSATTTACYCSVKSLDDALDERIDGDFPSCKRNDVATLGLAAAHGVRYRAVGCGKTVNYQCDHGDCGYDCSREAL